MFSTLPARPRVVRLAPLLLLGCGAQPPAASAPTPIVEAPAEVPPAAPAVAGARLESGELDYALTATDGRLTATCAEAGLTCAEVARAELAAPAGPEVVWRCDADESPRALVVAQGSAILWVADVSGQLGPGGADCDLPPAITVAVADVVPDAPQELYIRQTGCTSPAQLGDAEGVWRFVDGQATPVATARMACEWVGDTADPDAEPPPEDAAYNCVGGYLAVEAAGGAWSVQQLEPTLDGYISDVRDAQGRLGGGHEVARTPLRWDAASARFVPASP